MFPLPISIEQGQWQVWNWTSSRSWVDFCIRVVPQTGQCVSVQHAVLNVQRGGGFNKVNIDRRGKGGGTERGWWAREENYKSQIKG